MSLYERGKTNYVFIGEAGCGKTELSVNLARELAVTLPGEEINLIDMDQTKGEYRSRDFEALLAEQGINTLAGPSGSDAPIVPPNVHKKLSEPGAYCVMDVGGNKAGARMIGQFAEHLSDDTSLVFFPINPYRCFSRSTEDILYTMKQLAGVSGTGHAGVICNPNFGRDTTAEDILSGYERTLEMLNGTGLRIEALVIPEWIDPAGVAIGSASPALHIIKPYIRYI